MVRALPKRVEVVTLQDAPGMKLLPRRTGNTFERHAHEAARADTTSTTMTDDKGDAIDGHAWLDPDNAKAMVARIEQALSAKYPAQRRHLQGQRPEAQRRSLDALASELEGKLKPVAGKPYIVFHDAFQYLEAPLRPERGGLDLDQPRGAAERQAAHGAAQEGRRRWARCACSPSRSSTRGWCRT